ncbi:MAG: hypothetical protein HYV28_06020 [Ignavibacteriales bacterium]|nr:hypothetical protein [Ignavibacteriales bacterium]
MSSGQDSLDNEFPEVIAVLKSLEKETASDGFNAKLFKELQLESSADAKGKLSWLYANKFIITSVAATIIVISVYLFSTQEPAIQQEQSLGSGKTDEQVEPEIKQNDKLIAQSEPVNVPKNLRSAKPTVSSNIPEREIKQSEAVQTEIQATDPVSKPTVQEELPTTVPGVTNTTLMKRGIKAIVVSKDSAKKKIDTLRRKKKAD